MAAGGIAMIVVGACYWNSITGEFPPNLQNALELQDTWQYIDGGHWAAIGLGITVLILGLCGFIGAFCEIKFFLCIYTSFLTVTSIVLITVGSYLAWAGASNEFSNNFRVSVVTAVTQAYAAGGSMLQPYITNYGCPAQSSTGTNATQIAKCVQLVEDRTSDIMWISGTVMIVVGVISLVLAIIACIICGKSRKNEA